jgi:hypothetical protein
MCSVIDGHILLFAGIGFCGSTALKKICTIHRAMFPSLRIYNGWSIAMEEMILRFAVRTEVQQELVLSFQKRRRHKKRR